MAKKPKASKCEPIKGLHVQAGDDPTIHLYDEIGPGWAGMIDENALLAGLQEIGQPERFKLRINSPGGVVDIGSTMFNLLVDHPSMIDVRIDGIAASIASVIAMAGDTITVSDNSRFMIHNAMTIAWGNKHHMRETADMLDKADLGIINTYVARSGNTAEQIINWMDAETWFTADEAIEAGFADTKAAAVKNVAMRVPKNLYNNTPKDLELYDRKIPGIKLKSPPTPTPPEPIPGLTARDPALVATRLARLKARI